MTKHLDRDLDSLEQDLLAQSALVEEMIRLACRGLCERLPGIPKQLLALELRINQREVEIEEECLKVLALHQPVAVDLRRVTTVLKVNSDLERIADLAVNIGDRNEALLEYPQMPMPEFLDQMVEAAIEMVRDALDAFVDTDVEAARRVCRRDDEVDAYNLRIIERVREEVRSNPDLFDPMLLLFTASRHIERIADHATNIAEDIVYLVEGEITRHRGAATDTKSTMKYDF